MDLKTMIQLILWSAADGLAALWALHMIVGMATEEHLLFSLLEIAAAICG